MTIDRYTKYEDLPELLTVEEFCACLEMGRTTAYELVHTGEIPFVRFGRRIWIPKTVLKTSQSDTGNLIEFDRKHESSNIQR